MKTLFFAITILFLSKTAFAQDSLSHYPSISFHLGELLTAQRDFGKTFGSNAGFVYGGAVEFPLVTHLKIVGKLTYFFKSNGDFEWRQWITNTGLKYTLGLSQDFALTFSAGMALTIFLETQPIVTVLGRTTGNMMPGFFAGTGVEHCFSFFPVTVFFEVDYSQVDWKFPTYTHNYGGTVFSAGIRYRFVR
jgi:hypothetical protein